jgi:hypothetical protein
VLLGFGHEETRERLDTTLLVIVRSSVGRYEYLQIIQFDTNDPMKWTLHHYRRQPIDGPMDCFNACRTWVAYNPELITPRS